MAKPVPPLPQRLTPAQFKALAKYKGWTYRAMAARWGITPEHLSAIARNPERGSRYDDMLHGLPNLNRLGRDVHRMTRQVESAMARLSTSKVVAGSVKPLPPGYRYRGYLTTGAMVAATSAVGSVAEEGMRGIVFEVRDDGVREEYGVIFETGLWDWFAPEYVDMYLANIGLTAQEVVEYRYVDEAVLQDDFEAGKFEFWPAIEG